MIFIWIVVWLVFKWFCWDCFWHRLHNVNNGLVVKEIRFYLSVFLSVASSDYSERRPWYIDYKDMAFHLSVFSNDSLNWYLLKKILDSDCVSPECILEFYLDLFKWGGGIHPDIFWNIKLKHKNTPKIG